MQHYWIYLTALFLWVFLIVFEIKRGDKRFLILRLLANTAALFALVYMLLPLNYLSSEKHSRTELHILSSGAINTESAPKRIFIDPNLKTQFGQNAEWVNSLAYYLQQNPEINKVHIHGDGLLPDQLALLKDYEVSYSPSPESSGLQSIYWKPKLELGEEFTLQGRYRNRDKKAQLIKLKYADKTVDSAGINAGSTSIFQLQTKAEQLGRSQYTLEINDKNNTKEIIALEITPKAKIQSLILSGYPNFEFKFLKEWLYSQHQAVAFRSKISKEKYNTEFLNLNSFNLNEIHAKSLQAFDVLILDESAYELLSAAERSAISQAVNKGLGIIYYPQAEKGRDLFKAIALRKARADKNLGLLSDPGSKALNLLDIEAESSLQLSGSYRTLFKDKYQQIWAAESAVGKGKIVSTALNESYLWKLNGAEESYYNYWSSLLHAAAAQTDSSANWLFQPALPLVNEKLNLQITVDKAGIPQVYYKQQQLAALQHMAFADQWQVSFYPQQSGWQEVQLNKQKAYVYIYPQGAWSSVKTYDLQQLNQQAQHQNKELNKQASEQQLLKSVNKLYLFMLFILCISFLWFENKKAQKA